MTHLNHSSMESLVSLLSCSSDEYWKLYDGPSSTDDLAATAVTIIKDCEERLRGENTVYKLDNLLYAMLNEAPHPGGKRHVAAALQLAYATGQTTVVHVAKSWMEELFLPLLACTSLMKNKPRSADDQIFRQFNSESPIRLLWRARRTSDLGVQVSTREKHSCAIMKIIDICYVNKLALQGEQVNPSQQRGITKTGHIFPFAVADADDGQLLRKEPHLLDFFQAWTQLNSQDLSEHRMNSPVNAMYLEDTEYDELTRFKIYFDKAEFPDSPNKYRVHPIFRNLGLCNGKPYQDVQFPSFDESGFEPPGRDLLHVHACFAKVLFESGATSYYSKIAKHDDRGDPSTMDDPEGRHFLTYQMALLAL